MTDPAPQPCLRCGYDNAGLDDAEICPECGAAPPWSRGAPLSESEPRVRKGFARALMLMAFAAFCAALEPAIYAMWAYELFVLYRRLTPSLFGFSLEFFDALNIAMGIAFLAYSALFSASLWRMTQREEGDPLPFSSRPVMRWCAFALLVPPALNLAWTLAYDHMDWLAAWMYGWNDACAGLLLIAGVWCWTPRACIALRRVDPKFAETYRRAMRKRLVLVMVLWGASLALPYTPFGFPNHEEELVLRPLTALLLVSIGVLSFQASRRVAKA